MTITDEGKQLRIEVSKLRPDKRRRYGADLRGRILGWVDRAVASGMLEVDCSRLLGIKGYRFTLWRRSKERPAKVERESLALVPIDSPPVPMASGLAFVTPSGYRVEGLGLDHIVALLRELA
jgi:hypothetical protein